MQIQRFYRTFRDKNGKRERRKPCRQNNDRGSRAEPWSFLRLFARSSHGLKWKSDTKPTKMDACRKIVKKKHVFPKNRKPPCRPSLCASNSMQNQGLAKLTK